MERQQGTSPALLFDAQLEIAARTDPAALVRCAATCKDLRRRIADPAFRRRLRLRHCDRFVPSLLRGHHLIANRGHDHDHDHEEIHLVDTTSPYTTRVLSADACFPAAGPDGGKPLRVGELLGSRDGLLLVRTAGMPAQLRVCCPATGRSQALPPCRPGSDGHYVLLAGDGEGGGAIGRPFQVLKARLVFSDNTTSLHIKVFSSEHATWPGTYTKIPAPGIHGSRSRRLVRPLVVGDTVHWLCLTDATSYVLTLLAGAAQVTSTKLPASIHGACRDARLDRMLLASTAVGGRPVLLMADSDRISMWAQHERSARWKERPQVVADKEAVARFTQTSGLMGRWIGIPRMEWFAERSGVVLIRFPIGGLIWLDLRSRQIFRWFLPAGSWNPDSTATSFPYEMDLSSWVPTFRKSL